MLFCITCRICIHIYLSIHISIYLSIYSYIFSLPSIMLLYYILIFCSLPIKFFIFLVFCMIKSAELSTSIIVSKSQRFFLFHIFIHIFFVLLIILLFFIGMLRKFMFLIQKNSKKSKNPYKPSVTQIDHFLAWFSKNIHHITT